MFRHKDERRVRTADEDAISVAESMATESDVTDVTADSDTDSSGSEDESNKLDAIEENEEGNRPSDTSEGNLDVKPGTSEMKSEDVEGSKESDEEELEFPDTSIQLQHVRGDK